MDRECTSDHCRDHIIDQSVYGAEGRNIPYLENKRHVLRMLVYGVIGIAGCQMTYYLAVEDSNAGIATVLQYTAPVMIMVLLALKNWKLPGKMKSLP